MRTETKILAASLTLLLVPSSSYAMWPFDGGSTLGSQLQPIREKIAKRNLGSVTATKDPAKAAEEQCLPKLEDIKSKLPPQLDGFISRDGAAAASGTELLKATAESAPTAQLGTDEHSSSADKTGSLVKEKQAGIAGEAKAALDACRSTIKENCHTDRMDKSSSVAAGAKALHEYCTTGSSSAGTVYAQDKKDSMNLGDMAKTMGAAAQMLGAASQLVGLMNKGNQSGISGNDPNSGMSGATSPTGSSINGSTGPETSKLDSGTASSNTGPVIGGGKVGTNAAGSSTANDGSNYNWSKTTAWSTNSGGFGDPTAGGTAIGSHSGSGSGSGLHDSTGASTSGSGGRDPASAANDKRDGAGNYEVSGGGGMVNRASMMGLKPGGGELNDLGNGAGLGDAKTEPLADLGTGANPGAGGETAAAADQGLAPESLFIRVRGRYANLVKAGRF
jgi:hypothetical protein